MLHGDETGWRVNGKGHWLWCFSYDRGTYYLIDRQRGRPVLAKFFRRAFAGTLVTDFWGAYNAVVCSRRQVCLAHLLRDLKHVEQYKHPSKSWPKFAKKLRRLIRDGLRLKKQQTELVKTAYSSRRNRLHARLDALIATPWKDPQAKRLLKRFRRHRNHLVHVPRRSGCASRQQPRRTGDPSGGDHPQEQLRKSQPARSRLPSRADEHLSHFEATRPRSPRDNHQRTDRIPYHRKTSRLATITTSNG